ncbi:MAG: VOC family protein [Actinobacteria bacterium]|nr:VOC family protein [Actinomycetota bacterium]
MQVEQVDFVAIPTQDLDRAIAFYRDVIELPQSPHATNEFEAGNVTLAIWKPEDLGYEFKDNGQGDVALRVPDVAAARAELEGKGIEFVGETLDTGVCQMAFFADPDGNSLTLHRRYRPREVGHGES